MNNVKTQSVKVSGTGTVTSGKSPLERIADALNDNEQAATEVTEAVEAPVVLEQPRTNIDDQDGNEGIIEKAISEEAPVGGFLDVKKLPDQEPSMKISDRPRFDAQAVADPKKDDDDEGGILPYASTKFNSQSAEGSQFHPIGTNKDELNSKGKYEISGFKIQYIPKGQVATVSEDVRDFFDTVDEAIVRINGNKYIRPDGVVARITAGAPALCSSERE